MQVNPEDSPQYIYVTWSNPRMTDFENKVYYISVVNEAIVYIWKL